MKNLPALGGESAGSRVGRPPEIHLKPIIMEQIVTVEKWAAAKPPTIPN
jgi:hypothetical protein